MSDLDQEIERFFKRFERDVMPQVRGSAMTIGIWDGKADAKMCLEIGASVLMEKPLVVLVTKGAYLPPKLRLLATEIVEVSYPMDEHDKAAIKAALDRVTAELDRRKQPI